MIPTPERPDQLPPTLSELVAQLPDGEPSDAHSLIAHADPDSLTRAAFAAISHQLDTERAIERANMAATTARSTADILKPFLDELLMRRSLSDISAGMAQQWLADRLSDPEAEIPPELLEQLLNQGPVNSPIAQSMAETIDAATTELETRQREIEELRHQLEQAIQQARMARNVLSTQEELSRPARVSRKIIAGLGGAGLTAWPVNALAQSVAEQGDVYTVPSATVASLTLGYLAAHSLAGKIVDRNPVIARFAQRAAQ